MQKKIYALSHIKIFFLILCSVFLLQCYKSKAETLKNNTLRVGICSDYPPFEFMKNGEIVGFDADVAKLIANKMNAEIKFYDMGFSSLIPSLIGNKIDIAISSITHTEQRAKKIDFSNSYFNSSATFLSKAPIALKNKKIKIGAQLGTMFEHRLKALKIQNIELRNLVPQLIAELNNGKIDAILIDTNIASSIISKYPNQYMSSIDEGFGGQIAIAIKKDSQILDTINGIIDEINNSDAMTALQKKWALS